MSEPTNIIPKFNSEAEERQFWESPDNDSTEYLDWSQARTAIFPDLKPTTHATPTPAVQPA